MKIMSFGGSMSSTTTSASLISGPAPPMCQHTTASVVEIVVRLIKVGRVAAIIQHRRQPPHVDLILAGVAQEHARRRRRVGCGWGGRVEHVCDPKLRLTFPQE